jgi:hypothetical protein
LDFLLDELSTTMIRALSARAAADDDDDDDDDDDGDDDDDAHQSDFDDDDNLQQQQQPIVADQDQSSLDTVRTKKTKPKTRRRQSSGDDDITDELDALEKVNLKIFRLIARFFTLFFLFFLLKRSHYKLFGVDIQCKSVVVLKQKNISKRFVVDVFCDHLIIQTFLSIGIDKRIDNTSSNVASIVVCDRVWQFRAVAGAGVYEAADRCVACARAAAASSRQRHGRGATCAGRRCHS